MFRIKALKNHRQKLAIFGLLVFMAFLAGPTLKWLWPGNWWGTTLVVMMNENEARPCGGFATAFAEINVPLGGAKLQNSFALPPHNLGNNMSPLTQVSTTRQWWDLGDTTDLSTCAAQFASGYAQIQAVAPDRVVLLQSGVIEKWLQAINGVNLAGKKIDETTFFATTSRAVADVDRHDEKALAARKSPLSQIGKKLLLKTVFTPWNWYGVTRSFGAAEKNYQLYWHKVEQPKTMPWLKYPSPLVSVAEWNLGGGKSSRYLDKSWTTQLSQISPELWQAAVTLNVSHLGGFDEPLSQPWRGGFTMTITGQDDVFVPAEIAPGGNFTHTERFTLRGSDLFLPRKQQSQVFGEIRLYAPSFQNWHTNLQVRAPGQQLIMPHQGRLKVTEGAGTWKGKMVPEGEVFSFALKPDNLAPFLTWHKPISALSLEPQTRIDLQHTGQDVIVEVHFNEPVMTNITAENIRLIDRDYEVKNVSENPSIKKAVLLPSRQTLLVNVAQNVYQKNERFYLEIDAVADDWGNTANIKNRTVITR